MPAPEGSNHETVDYEIRLYENSDLFDFVYGFGELFSDFSSVGVQDGGSQYTTYSCDLPGSYNYQTIHWIFHLRLSRYHPYLKRHRRLLYHPTASGVVPTTRPQDQAIAASTTWPPFRQTMCGP